MAEINIGKLANVVESLGVQVEGIKGDIGEVGDEPIADVLEEYGKFIAYANAQLNGYRDPGTGDMVPGILTRLAAVEERKSAGQPDWFLNTDPEAAGVWLDDLNVYITRVLPYVIKEHTKLKLTACWPWHPRAVAELLISMCHYRAAHKGGVPTPAADMWRQWLDGTVSRVNDLLSACQLIHKAEHVDTTSGQIIRDWTVDQAQLPAYLTWWCTTDREGIPPGLRRKT